MAHVSSDDKSPAASFVHTKHSKLTRRPCGNFELLVELAAGGMATVFLARAADGRDAPLVAIKRPHRHLASDKTFLSMLVDEARLASAIRHDNVVKVRELGFDNGEPFIVMDYVEGASLSDIRKELSEMGRALDPRFAVRITLDALAGLEAAHQLCDEQGKHIGIIHRDVSPHNVLIGCDGRACLTDFGIAKAADRVQTTRTHEVKGKLAYLAPERIDKRRLCTVQSDVFSMAVVLWECIAGRRLFRGDEAIETLQEVMTGPIPSLRQIGAPISVELDDAILRGLSRDLDTRWKTAANFADGLKQASGANLAAPAEIASLIEALFGERLRVRHESIREALDVPDLGRVLEVSGLNVRPAPTPEMRERERSRVATIAPPAPSERYAFDAGAADGGSIRGRLSSPRARMFAAAGVAFVAFVVAFGVFATRSRTQTAQAADLLQSRRVVVPLPFVATRVTFDEQARDTTPPSDTVAFDVPRESGLLHRVTAVAVDGSRAEAYVRELDGVARPEGGAYAIEAFETVDAQPDEPAAAAIELPPTPSAMPVISRTRRPRTANPRPKPQAQSALSPSSVASSTKPVGTLKDGFTKLK
ncbi:serine/threonine protein kinase [Labilithrix luteola]|uniref:Serine/threonine protein kinase n=1 Tax=Labilithrix luteola TaxID=1391654 RepID=A0A0K1PTH8_9BACT|nr:serine/threonine-protein kinase [Labilithrix luteola]AKU96835.1 serine/threonine protein kinase [Labilithrix luteola]